MKQEQAVPKRRKPWISMKITEVGNLTETILEGGGKISAMSGDTGEPRKQKPTG
jgi:hypothetical protein